MKRSLIFALLLAMLAVTPRNVNAQDRKPQTQTSAKAWATYSAGVLTFSYGAKPKAPTQVECTGCSRKMTFTTNFCSNCGTKNNKDFIVYDALERIPSQFHEDGDCPWYDKSELIKKIVFNATFKQVNNITNMSYWFSGMENLVTIIGLENLNTSRVTNMESMFDGCSKLTTINLTHFDTSNVTNMFDMFSGCESLTSLDLSSFRTDKVTTMAGMFDWCSSLASIKISSFKTDNVTNMNSMFINCRKLTSLNLSNFNTSKVKAMSYMFGSCESLTSLNLSSFNTSSVVIFDHMFKDCESLTSLDISNFDTRKASDTDCMFENCVNLKTVYVSATNWVGLRYRPTAYRPSLMPNCPAAIIKK